MFFIFLFTKNNTTLSPGFLGQWCNNLQLVALLASLVHDMTKLLMSLVQYEKVLSKFGQQQLFVVHYVCSFNQLDLCKLFAPFSSLSGAYSTDFNQGDIVSKFVCVYKAGHYKSIISILDKIECNRSFSILINRLILKINKNR